MNIIAIFSLKASARRLFCVALATVLGLLSACTSIGKDETAFDQLTLSPGDTGNCESSPCQVSLQIPAGTGSYEVTANETKIGVYPAGQNADLGSFFQSQAFEIKGMKSLRPTPIFPTDPEVARNELVVGASAGTPMRSLLSPGLRHQPEKKPVAAFLRRGGEPR
jgi:hypothetical protein